MKNSLILINSLLLLENSISPSFKESYAISFPTSINLNNSGSFEIGLDSSNLSDKDYILISLENEFVLNDSHGKPDITGNISNNEVTFANNDLNTQTVYYNVNESSAGDWHGNLGINIEVITQSSTNTFADGISIQKKLNRLKPTKITFSHDTQINGTYTYDLSLENDGSILLYRNGTELTITNMCNNKFKANENMSSFFKSLSNLACIENIDYIDMSTCTNIANMFFGCYKLESLDLSGWDVSNVKDMSHAFDSMSICTSLGDLSNWNVTNVESFQNLFNGDQKLEYYGDISKWNISNNCKNLSRMFSYSSYISGQADGSFFPASLNLNNWDVSNVTNMSGMFINAYNIQSIDISMWNCSNVTNMNQMFMMEENTNIPRLNSIIGIDNLNISNSSKVDLFKNCKNLSLPSWYQ